MPGRTAIFLDRDGLINLPPPPECRYVTCPAEFHLMPGIAAAIRLLNHHGIPVGVVTNQKGIALGRYSVADLERIHERMQELLAQEGAHVDDVQFCPHQESDRCTCRKPLPGMIFQGAAALDVDPALCWMVGDQPRDLMAGRAAGCTTVGVGSTRFPPEITDHVVAETGELKAWFQSHFPFQKV